MKLFTPMQLYLHHIISKCTLVCFIYIINDYIFLYSCYFVSAPQLSNLSLRTLMFSSLIFLNASSVCVQLVLVSTLTVHGQVALLSSFAVFYLPLFCIRKHRFISIGCLANIWSQITSPTELQLHVDSLGCMCLTGLHVLVSELSSQMPQRIVHNPDGMYTHLRPLCSGRPYQGLTTTTQLPGSAFFTEL